MITLNTTWHMTDELKSAYVEILFDLVVKRFNPVGSALEAYSNEEFERLGIAIANQLGQKKGVSESTFQRYTGKRPATRVIPSSGVLKRLCSYIYEYDAVDMNAWHRFINDPEYQPKEGFEEEMEADAIEGKISKDNALVTANGFSARPTRPLYFRGREKNLLEIHHYFTNPKERDPILLLNGTGGMGKTTLMQEYLYQDFCVDFFDRLIYIAVNQNVKSAFISDCAIALGIDLTQTVIQEEQLIFVKSKLKACEGNKLLVIDNINEADRDELVEMSKHFREIGWKVLITTRTSPDGFKKVNVAELKKKDARLLFVRHFEAADSWEEAMGVLKGNKKLEKQVNKLIKHAHRHTLLLELLAKTGFKKGFTVKDLLKRLKAADYKHAELQRKVMIGAHADNTFKKRSQTSTVHQYISDLFLPEFWKDEGDKTMLRFFSVLPPKDIPINDLKLLWCVTKDDANEFEDRLDGLQQYGWLIDKHGYQQKQAQHIAYKMHPLIQEVVYEKLLPNEENCRPLITSITDIISNPMEQPYAYQSYAQSVIDKLTFLHNRK